MTPENALPWLLIPGFMLDETLWDDMVHFLPFEQETHRAEPLHGNSIAEIAQRIASRAPPRFVLIGFSLGGYVARSIVQQFPERVAALVLIATSLRPDTPERQRLKQAAVEASAQGHFCGLSLGSIAQSVHHTRVNDKVLIKRIRDISARMGHATFASQSLLRRDDAATQDIGCPTLIIAANEDKLRSPEEAQELLVAIPGAEIEVIENCGHMIPLEQPELLASLILNWALTTFGRHNGS